MPALRWPTMIDCIEIMDGDSGWPQAAPLLKEVWPAEVAATLPWRDIVWATPDLRVLGFSRHNEVIGHVGIVLRDATWDDRAVKIGGIGGVATRGDSRRRGVGSMLVRRALKEIDETHRADFGLLFCEPRHAPLYAGLGWRQFEGHVFVMQPGGRGRFTVTDPYTFDLKMAPRTGVLDLCGMPW